LGGAISRIGGASGISLRQNCAARNTWDKTRSFGGRVERHSSASARGQTGRDCLRWSKLFAAGDGRGAIDGIAPEWGGWRCRARVEKKRKKQTGPRHHRARPDLFKSFWRYFLGRDSGGTNPDKR
jgi:hypothetical protein